jgi:hypothetical protein
VCKHFSIKRLETYPPWFFHSARRDDKILFIVRHSSQLWADTIIYNKSFHNFSHLEIPTIVSSVLGMNTKFIYKTPYNPRLVQDDLSKFDRQIRLHSFFRHRPERTTFQRKFHVHSTWQPPHAHPSIDVPLQKLHTTIHRYSKKIMAAEHTKLRCNKKTRALPSSLSSFFNNPDILIKPSDKNLGLTVITTEWYLEEAGTQLGDPFTYEYISSPISQVTEALFDYLQNRFNLYLPTLRRNGLITDQQEKFIQYGLSHHNTLPEFHLIPKIHKSPMQGRPIIPSHSWLTTNLSIWLDHFIQSHILPQLPMVIRDTKDLIRRLDNISNHPLRNPNQPLWVITGDITSMYTNIPVIDGSRALVHYSRSIPNKSLPADCVTIISNICRDIMQGNFFTFQGDVFHQISGTAMGTACAPAYANTFMHKYEASFFRHHPHKETCLFYGRYIDDILIIGQGAHGTIMALLNQLGSLHPAMKITWNISDSHINFLDVNVHVVPHIYVSIYQKPLHKYLYVPFKSYHPLVTKKAFIKAELIRYVRNNSHQEDFFDIARKFFFRLRERGYPPRLLKYLFYQVDFFDRPKYLLDRPSNDQRYLKSSDLPFVITNNPLWEHIPLLDLLQVFIQESLILKTPKILIRRPKNLLDHINKANRSKLFKRQVIDNPEELDEPLERPPKHSTSLVRLNPHQKRTRTSLQ